MCNKQDIYSVTDNIINTQNELADKTKKAILEENHYFTLWLRCEQNCSSIFYKEDDESQTLGRSPKYWVALQKKFFLYQLEYCVIDRFTYCGARKKTEGKPALSVLPS
jgi:hypothetical protein